MPNPEFNVLFYEANPHLAVTFMYLFEAAEYKKAGIKAGFLHVTNNEQMKHMLFSNSDNRQLPGVIIMDLSSAGDDTIMMMQEIRKDSRWNETPIICISCSFRPEEAAMYLDYGASAFLYEPTMEQIESKVLEVLGFTDGANHND